MLLDENIELVLLNKKTHLWNKYFNNFKKYAAINKLKVYVYIKIDS